MPTRPCRGDNRKMTFACDLPPFGLDVVDMKMLALTDGFDNLPDIGAVLEDGVADIQSLRAILCPIGMSSRTLNVMVLSSS